MTREILQIQRIIHSLPIVPDWTNLSGIATIRQHDQLKILLILSKITTKLNKQRQWNFTFVKYSYIKNELSLESLTDVSFMKCVPFKIPFRGIMESGKFLKMNRLYNVTSLNILNLQKENLAIELFNTVCWGDWEKTYWNMRKTFRTPTKENWK